VSIAYVVEQLQAEEQKKTREFFTVTKIREIIEYIIKKNL
jgi:hypothetical protein